jgi:CHASE2 domain-containing sensor protein
MDTNDRVDRIEVIKAVRVIGKGLRRAGLLFALLSLAALVGNSLDSRAGDIIATAALGLITVLGLIMFTQAGGILRMIDKAAMDALTRRGPR